MARDINSHNFHTSLIKETGCTQHAVAQVVENVMFSISFKRLLGQHYSCHAAQGSKGNSLKMVSQTFLTTHCQFRALSPMQPCCQIKRRIAALISKHDLFDPTNEHARQMHPVRPLRPQPRARRETGRPGERHREHLGPGTRAQGQGRTQKIKALQKGRTCRKTDFW